MSTKRNLEDESAIRVAKVSAKAAILVALITTLGGAATGYFLRLSEHTPKTLKLHWLKIERVESSHHLDVRLVATVNGMKFSYPSSSLWQEVGPGMSAAPERFLLPPGEKSYRVSFFAFQTYRPEDLGSEGEQQIVGEATSPSIYELDLERLPSGVLSYDLHGNVRTFSRGGDRETAIRIFYSLE